MNVALRRPSLTRQQFLDWAAAQEGRYEFDGFQPVAMTGGTINHNIIALNVHRSLYDRLKGTGCHPLGPDAGVATTGDAVRYPDALVTCTKFRGTDRLVPGVLVVFEVISPTSGYVDRIVKPREYHAVPTIKRYVIVESDTIGLTVLGRASDGDPWTSVTRTATDMLVIPELGIEIPVSEFYDGTDIPRVSDNGDVKVDDSAGGI